MIGFLKGLFKKETEPEIDNSKELCSDCVHCVEDDYELFPKKARIRYAKCALTKNDFDGEPESFCRIERVTLSGCGVKGINFKHK